MEAPHWPRAIAVSPKGKLEGLAYGQGHAPPNDIECRVHSCTKDERCMNAPYAC